MTLSGLGFSIFAFMMTPVGALLSFLMILGVILGTVYVLRSSLRALYQRLVQTLSSLWHAIVSSPFEGPRSGGPDLSAPKSDHEGPIAGSGFNFALPACYKDKDDNQKQTIKTAAINVMLKNAVSIRDIYQFLESDGNSQKDKLAHEQLAEAIFDYVSQMIIKEQEKKIEITAKIFNEFLAQNTAVQEPDLRDQIATFLNAYRPEVFLAKWEVKDNKLFIAPQYLGADEMSFVLPQGCQLIDAAAEPSSKPSRTPFTLAGDLSEKPIYHQILKIYEDLYKDLDLSEHKNENASLSTKPDLKQSIIKPQ